MSLIDLSGSLMLKAKPLYQGFSFSVNNWNFIRTVNSDQRCEDSCRLFVFFSQSCLWLIEDRKKQNPVINISAPWFTTVDTRSHFF